MTSGPQTDQPKKHLTNFKSDPQPYEDNLAGRSVLVKNLTPQTLQPRWTGPYLVIYSTLTAVRLQDPPHWVHRSRIKLCPSDSQPNPSSSSWKSQVLSPTSLKHTRISEEQ
uniref:Endogenous retrovirus H D1 leader region/integrase-derived ORF1, ORF2, and putative envelope protein mRNA n=2 Tax=root TaxID=1 RepID=V9H055_HUMAN|nr:ORF derived from D1 leader region and integrase coding region [Homo sapiens]